MKEAPLKLAKNTAERASRGEVIITQKEAKGEYGDTTWLWNNDTSYGMPADYGNQEIEPHVFDTVNSEDTPARMTNFGTSYGYCTKNETITSYGDILSNGRQMANQKSCSPSTGNVGNYYGWVTAMAGDNVSSGEARDSICPKNWQLPNSGASDIDKSFAKIVSLYEPSLGEDSQLRASAVSFIHSGFYRYSTAARYAHESYGLYWSDQTKSRSVAHGLNTNISNVNPLYPDAKGYGYAVRCLAR